MTRSIFTGILLTYTDQMNQLVLTIFKLILVIIIFEGCNSGNQNNSILEGKENQVIVNFPEIKKNIKIVARVWGIAENHEEISILSNSESNIKVVVAEQTFYTSEIFYKKKDKNTLLVFAPLSSYKDDVMQMIAGVKIEIHSLIHANEIQRYNNNYKKMGLRRVSVYD